MANQTANLDAPYISQAQSQPEVVANSAFDVFDGALGSLLVTAMSDANYTLNTSATPDEVTSYLAYKFTGTLTAGRNIVIPLTHFPARTIKSFLPSGTQPLAAMI